MVDTEPIKAISLPRRPVRRLRRPLNVTYFHQMKNDDGLAWANDPDNPPACQGIVAQNPELDHAFFPDGNGDDLHVTTRRSLCETCPVMAACRNFAYANDYIGVWGGEHITQDAVDRRRRARRRTNQLARQQLRVEAALMTATGS